jgi:antitoxin component of RelBE/YafQ-DinJ toxin-antitoxin module
MNEAMVTARMSSGKKEAVAGILKGLKTTPSQAINALYDYVIAHGALPFGDDNSGSRRLSKEDLASALEWVDEISLPRGNRFASMTDADIKRERLASSGLMEEPHGA